MEELENLEELASLQNQVEETRAQNKIGKQTFHEKKKVFEPVTDKIKNNSVSLTKNLTESSIENNQALESLNNNLSERVNDRAKIASYL